MGTESFAPGNVITLTSGGIDFDMTKFQIEMSKENICELCDIYERPGAVSYTCFLTNSGCRGDLKLRPAHCPMVEIEGDKQ